jgi:uncharacterized protein YlxP (DUF503 family)
MQVLAARFDLRVPQSRSLKEKRQAIRPIVDGVRARFSISCAEVGDVDDHQRSVVGAAVVSGAVSVCESVIDDVERFIWSRPDIDVLDVTRTWLEP